MSAKKEYHGNGISFIYPEGWELSVEPQDESTTITVAMDGAFWSVTILKHRPRASQVLAEAIDAFQEEYDDVDEYPVDILVAGVQAEALNLEFVALELINCVYLRAVEAGDRTLFVMAQLTDHERDLYEGAFNAMTYSLQVDPQHDSLEFVEGPNDIE